MAFLNEQFPTAIDYGSSNGAKYSGSDTITRGGNSYESLHHPYPQISCSLGFNKRTQVWLMTSVVDFFHKVGGMYGSAFRVKNLAEYSTNSNTGTPTYNDQACTLVSTGVYQLTKWYGTESLSTATRRRLRKPVSGTALVGIRDDFNNPVAQTNGFTVDYTTGEITFDANKTYAITDITQALNAVLTIGAHTLVANDTVHISSVSGMTEINGLRGTIQSATATTITVDIDSSAFTAYTSAGDVNTRPQTNETVTGGCEFDLPMRFNSDLSDINFSDFESLSVTVELIEKLNP